jgi:hypothetical protein
VTRERLPTRDDHQRADAVVGEIRQDTHEDVRRLRGHRRAAGAAEPPYRHLLEHLAQLLLEDDHDHHQEDGEEPLEDPRRQLQLEHARDDVEGAEDEHPRGHEPCLRAAEPDEPV